MDTVKGNGGVTDTGISDWVSCCVQLRDEDEEEKAAGEKFEHGKWFLSRVKFEFNRFKFGDFLF